MKNKFPENIISKIKIRINEYINSKDTPTYLQEIAMELDILPLFLDMGNCFGIRSDGEIISFHFDGEYPAHVEEDPKKRNLALYQGSKLYPELKEIIPTKPKNAKVCNYCNKAGFGSNDLISTSDPIVCICGGLGWVVDEYTDSATDLDLINYIHTSIEFDSVGSFTPSSNQHRITDILDITRQQAPLTLNIKRSAGNQLKIAVISSDLSIKSVVVRILGQHETIIETLELVANGPKALGEKFYPDFERLIQKLGNKMQVSVSSR